MEIDADNEHGLDDEMQDNQPPAEKQLMREAPTPEPGRAALVKYWNDQVKQAKDVYEDRFKEMRRLQRFARGKQWDGNEKKYVTNVTLRHLRQTVSRLYAKNPTAVTKMRERLEHTVWDGKMASVAAAQQVLQMAQQAQPALAQNPDPSMIQMVQGQMQQAQAVLADYQQVMALRQQLERLAKTMELLYDYNIDEQALPFKTLMKLSVLRSKTTGVAWVKLGFQRATQLKPDYESRIQDISARLRRIEQMSADIADGVTPSDGKEAEELRLQIQALTEEGTTLVREGLTFDYPASTSIIPDLNCRHLKTFMGCRWVAQEYLLPLDEIERIYGIDVASQHASYTGRATFDAAGANNTWASSNGLYDPSTATASASGKLALVREIYCKDDGMVYVVCDGYPEFLQEPGPPDVWTERFFPWFALIFNEVDDPEDAEHPFPLSDVELIEDAQREINRSREGLREHRIANRPGYAAPMGTLSDNDKSNLTDRPFNAIVELSALQPGQKVADVLQGLPSVPIDPNVYQTNAQFEDILHAGGMQEANLGPTSGATATESSIAQASSTTVSNADVDELDDFLTLLARSGGQVLLQEVSEQTAKEIVGPGAVWPTLSRDQIARDLWLEVEAGSTGRPNQAQEIANAERLVPLLLQIPGISPEGLARDLIRRLDDRLDIASLQAEGLPSIVAMNAAARPATGDPSTDPGQQGGQGAQNVTTGNQAPGPAQGVDTTSEGPDSDI